MTTPCTWPPCTTSHPLLWILGGRTLLQLPQSFHQRSHSDTGLAPQVQEEMVNEVWSDDTLRLAPCQPVHSAANDVLFLGPRVKMGIYEGRPTRICPHTTTGRADYFGPFVNRRLSPLEHNPPFS